VVVVVVIVVVVVGIVEFITCLDSTYLNQYQSKFPDYVSSWSKYLFITNENTASNITLLAWAYAHIFSGTLQKNEY